MMTDPKGTLVGSSYKIKLKGHLCESWADWFEGLAFTHEDDGTTTLTGKNIDQAALHGLLKKIRDLGLPLLSVNQLDPDQPGLANADQITDEPSD